MKFKQILFSIFIFQACESYAQVSSKKMDLNATKSIASSGLRLSLGMTALQMETRGQGPKTNLQNVPSFAIGYADFPAFDFGGYAGVKYLEIPKNSDQENFEGLAIVEAVTGYTYSTTLTFKLGFNLSKFIKGENARSTLLDFGIQGGLGIQFNPVVGLDLTYRKSNQQSTDAEYILYHQSQSEVAISATF
jgi:hypothetical protein